MISRLTSNQTLSFLSVAYGFDKRMRTSSTVDGAVGSSQKTAADLFEAHVGGLVLAGQNSALHEWLDQLFSPRGFPSIRDLAATLVAEMPQKRSTINLCKRKASNDGKSMLLYHMILPIVTHWGLAQVDEGSTAPNATSKLDRI